MSTNPTIDIYNTNIQSSNVSLSGLTPEHKAEIMSLITKYKESDSASWLRQQCIHSDGNGYWYTRACEELCAVILHEWNGYAEPVVAYGSRMYENDFYKLIENLGINTENVERLLKNV